MNVQNRIENLVNVAQSVNYLICSLQTQIRELPKRYENKRYEIGSDEFDNFHDHLDLTATVCRRLVFLAQNVQDEVDAAIKKEFEEAEENVDKDGK